MICMTQSANNSQKRAIGLRVGWLFALPQHTPNVDQQMAKSVSSFAVCATSPVPVPGCGLDDVSVSRVQKQFGQSRMLCKLGLQTFQHNCLLHLVPV